MSSISASKAVLGLLRQAGRPMRGSELTAGGAASRATLARMVEAGLIERVAHTIYRLPDYTSEHADWAALALAMPQSVVCLRSAAAFHRITQVMPVAIDVAVPYGSGRSAGGEAFRVAVNVFQWRNSESFGRGVKVHTIDGIEVNITTPERTVVDMIRFSDLNPSNDARGVRVTAEEALDCFHRALDPNDGLADADEVGRLAEQFGVGRVVRAQIQSLNFAVQRGYGA